MHINKQNKLQMCLFKCCFKKVRVDFSMMLLVKCCLIIKYSGQCACQATNIKIILIREASCSLGIALCSLIIACASSRTTTASESARAACQCGTLCPLVYTARHVLNHVRPGVACTVDCKTDSDTDKAAYAAYECCLGSISCTTYAAYQAVSCAVGQPKSCKFGIIM